MPDAYRAQADSIIRSKLREYLIDKKWILFYVSYGTETDTGVLIRELLETPEKNVHIAVPKVKGDEMEFYEIKSFSDLVSGYKGILEPKGDVLAQPSNALMVMPGLVFDRRRNRIGYGGGYYDRYLAQHSEQIEKTVAAAYDLQVMPHDIKTAPHDIKPDCIVTEKAVYN